MADDIVVFANTVEEEGKDPFAKDGDDQVGGKEDGRHLVDGLFGWMTSIPIEKKNTYN